jgi:myosin heavy subunit
MFSDEELNDIFRLLSAVLHLGNLKFEGECLIDNFDKRSKKKFFFL